MFKLHILHPNLQKIFVKIVFKMSISDLQESRLSRVRACLSQVRACLSGVRARLSGVRARLSCVRARLSGVRKNMKTLITLLFLSFQRREKNLCHNHIFRICKKRFKINFTFKFHLEIEKHIKYPHRNDFFLPKKTILFSL